MYFKVRYMLHSCESTKTMSATWHSSLVSTHNIYQVNVVSASNTNYIWCFFFTTVSTPEMVTNAGYLVDRVKFVVALTNVPRSKDVVEEHA